MNSIPVAHPVASASHGKWIHGAKSPFITLGMAAGFTPYVVKAILSGRADEVIDLASANFCQ